MSEYVSTRGAYVDEPRSFNDVLLEGLAPDGGLYVPDTYPRFRHEDLLLMSSLAYPQLVVEVRSKLVGNSIPLDEQLEMVDRAYTAEKFSGVKEDNYTPLRQIGHNLFVENLSLGPTAAFKDMAMQLIAQDTARELARRGLRITYLGATSGDTGSAAEHAFGQLGNVDLLMLSPDAENGTMTPVQRAQMAKLSSNTVYNISMSAPFGELQDLVKEIKKDPEFADLGAVNSINWARVASQIPYYFSGYFQAIEQSGSSAKIGDEVDFVVPSGNMGNAVAGYIARKMGLPIRNIVVATNENQVLHRLIQHGEYVREKTQLTTSPSMDIDSASNYERPLFDILDRDAAKTTEYMDIFKRNGAVSFADVRRDDIDLKRYGFDSGTSNGDQRLQTIRRIHQEGHGFIDPHTADGVGVALGRGERDVPTIVLETASPVKFEDTIRKAVGHVPERDVRFKNIEQSLQREFGFVAMRYDLDTLKDFIRTCRQPK